jgi:hypothetical protein
MKMKFRNPSNGYEEEVSSLTWLWCLLFGCFYFLVKGVWTHAIVGLILAMVTFWFSWLIYPFFAKGIIIKRYQRNGWILVE